MAFHFAVLIISLDGGANVRLALSRPWHDDADKHAWPMVLPRLAKRSMRRRLEEHSTMGRRYMSLATRGASFTQSSRTVGLRRSYVRVGHFISMMKPRVMSLVMFTALVGLLIAPGPFDPSRDFIALLCIAAGAGGAAVLNMWYDADVDAVMTRTAMRPIPSGRVSRVEALIFGLMLASGAIGLLGFTSNKIAATLLTFTIFFYIVVYTIWLKRRTSQNIVIGGAAGALPPVIGWAVSTGRIGVEPLVLFLIIFLWTPAHFWALSLNHAGEYARAGIPMLPVVAGRAETKKQILIYSILLVLVSTMPWVLGFAGATYCAIAVVFGARMILLAARLRGSADDTETGAASRLFAFSIVYLFILFASLLADAAIHGRPA
jgi:protoheme IX farnesyltransferase